MTEPIKINTPAKDPTHAIFGSDPEGGTLHLCLSEGPHWLVCGQTGSGKSVAMNFLNISCMFHASPDELRVTWIDPKKVEGTPYKGLPYCPIDPVSNLGDAYGLIAYMVWEMYRRYAEYEKAGVKKIADFNAWFEANEEKARSMGINNKHAYWILVIDEYADLSQTGGHELEELVKKLGAMARGSGQILMIATQRPSAESISSTLKSNIPSRVALRVTSAINSDIILDHDGAEKLKGKGDAIIKLPSGDEERIQFPFVTDDEMAAIFGRLREKFEPFYERGDYFCEFEKQHLVDPFTSTRSSWYGYAKSDYEVEYELDGDGNPKLDDKGKPVVKRDEETGEVVYKLDGDGNPVVRVNPKTGQPFSKRQHTVPYEKLLEIHKRAKAKAIAEGKPDAERMHLQIDYKSIATDLSLAKMVRIKDVLCDWAQGENPDETPLDRYDDWHVGAHRKRLGSRF